MNTPLSNMVSVYDLYNEAMYQHVTSPPIYKPAPNTQMESDSTRDRKGILSHPIPSNVANPRQLEGSEIGTIDESLLKLYNKINGNVVTSSEKEYTEEKEGFREERPHLGGNHNHHSQGHGGGGHHIPMPPSYYGGGYIPVVNGTNYYMSSPPCNSCSTKPGDELMFKVYMGSMTVVGLLILYRILQK